MALLIVAVLVALVAPLSPAAATDDEDPIYLSLGMSYAAGTMADSTGDDIPFTNLSYTDQLFPQGKGTRVAPSRACEARLPG
jgi:hypothetical protein